MELIVGLQGINGFNGFIGNELMVPKNKTPKIVVCGALQPILQPNRKSQERAHVAAQLATRPRRRDELDPT